MWRLCKKDLLSLKLAEECYDVVLVDLGDLRDTIEAADAMEVALKAWLTHDRNVQTSLGPEYYRRAIELTKAAGVMWPSEAQE